MGDLVDQAGDGGREIAERREGQLSDAVARMALLREALTNPNVQPEKAAAMAELMFKMEDRDRQTRFIEAKVAAIAEMPRIGKDGQNSNTGARYAKWETMQPIIVPILARHGLVLTFKISDQNGKVAVTPVLSGHGWQEEGDAMVFPADTGPGRNAVQAVASAASYGKRHTAMAMLNLVQGGLIEDDDGAAAGGTATDAYAQLQPDMRDLVDAGRQASLGGTAEYEEWFSGLPTKHKGFLNFNQAWPDPLTWHAQNKAAAAKVGA